MSLNKRNGLTDSEYTLFLLKEIESNPKTTQRDLARSLSLSLGKVNFLIKALMEKGVIEMRNFKNSKNKMAYMYLITPSGIRMKIKLTHDFFAWKLQEYEKLKNEIELFRGMLKDQGKEGGA